MKNKKKGFTLAEVLITLSILGVVAAISIPNIIQQYQKRLTITKLQQAYSILENAAQNIAINSGCIGKDLNCTGLLNYSNNNSSDLSEKIIELSNFKIKGKYYNNLRNYKALNYDSMNADNQSRAMRGVRNIFINSNNIGFSFNISNIYTKNRAQQPEGISAILVTVFTAPDDIIKKSSIAPNYSKKTIDGKNVFGFVIYDNFIVEPVLRGGGGKVWPISKLGVDSWATESYFERSCNPHETGNSYGTSCAAKIIKDGWKITYY